MAKAIYIKSYAHAEQLGIKPFGSLISTVAIPAKKPKIVAFQGSHTSSAKDRGKYTLGRMQTWVDRDGYRYYATTKPMLDILLRALFTRKPRLVKVSYGR
jgi:hypothetical protein